VGSWPFSDDALRAMYRGGKANATARRFPLGMAHADGQWYLVSMLGEDCNWVQNVRAAGGKVTLRRRRAQACHLIEVLPAERAPIIKQYLAQVPGARPHIPVDRRSTLAEFETIADKFPVFRVSPASARA
jgi:hypothetical protein